MAKEMRDCRKEHDMGTGTEEEGSWYTRGSVRGFVWLKYALRVGMWSVCRCQLMGTLTPCVDRVQTGHHDLSKIKHETILQNVSRALKLFMNFDLKI